MARKPEVVAFECKSCGHQSTADERMAKNLLPSKRKLPIDESGLCTKCGGDSWNIHVVYAQSGADTSAGSAVGLGLGAMTGIGFVETSTAATLTSYPDVPAAVVARLNEDPAQRISRVVAFANLIAQEELRERGGQNCGTCRALFVPAKGNTWHEEGYCSKVCLVKAKGESAIDKSSPAQNDRPRRVSAIEVECPSGHRFEVPASFAGMMRPCPTCGTKTPVVEALPASPTLDVGDEVHRPSARDGEKLTKNFVAAILKGHFKEKVFDFKADRELSKRDRVEAFRALDQLVRSQSWRLRFTEIEVLEGYEERVTTYFFGKRGGLLVLSARFDPGLRKWKIDYYETEHRSFARSADEDFYDYVARSIEDVLDCGSPYVGPATVDGKYYIEYSK
jgi:hypothetical protein